VKILRFFPSFPLQVDFISAIFSGQLVLDSCQLDSITLCCNPRSLPIPKWINRHGTTWGCNLRVNRAFDATNYAQTDYLTKSYSPAGCTGRHCATAIVSQSTCCPVDISHSFPFCLCCPHGCLYGG